MLETQLEYIRTITDFKPEIALVLGSGLGDFADEVNQECIINYSDIPDFPVSTAPNHKGRYIFCTIEGRKVVIMQGRVHLYEGYSPAEIVMPIRLTKLMGAKMLFLTNAAGGIGRHLNIGDLMVIDDHISCFVPSALVGKNDESIGLRFPDMSEVYSKKLSSAIFKAGNELDVNLKNGVYLQLQGPNFETPAEIRMAGLLGADAVGMSTAIEAQAAKHCGFEVCGISVISNLACGISKTPITSEEVKETADRIAPIFKKVIRKAISNF
ncbi:MAG: purine-nucleoside phosphorylase [Acetobacter sp.]|nr:purine-nucleoside phosphorylase [Bacteroides sp.]MCM1342160.1 purine-nucleoside phosphorylase [Acetobacter sp.]MCM1434367.1 purine-nucleoside phosphorylase [Clostridiales bacterium]